MANDKFLYQLPAAATPTGGELVLLWQSGLTVQAPLSGLPFALSGAGGGLASGAVTSGLLGDGSVNSGNVASGAIGQFALASGVFASVSGYAVLAGGNVFSGVQTIGGQVGINTSPLSGAQLAVTPADVNTRAVVFQGLSGQTADIAEVRDNSGNSLVAMGVNRQTLTYNFANDSANPLFGRSQFVSTLTAPVSGDAPNSEVNAGLVSQVTVNPNADDPDFNEYSAICGVSYVPSGNAFNIFEVYGVQGISTYEGANGGNVEVIGVVGYAESRSSGALSTAFTANSRVYANSPRVLGSYNLANVYVGTADLVAGAYGTAGVIGAGAIATELAGIWVPSPTVIGTVGLANYGVYVKNQISANSPNSYGFWYDSPGVFRIHGDGVMAYYNPVFTKYTPGATDYERVVLQWSGNVAQLMTEAGPSGGTSRNIRLGPANGILVAPSGNVTVGGVLSLFSGQVAEPISGVRAVSVTQSGLLRIAMASVSGRMPAVGVVIDNVASGGSAAVYTAGVIQYTSGLFNGLGHFGQPAWVGRSGHVVPISGSFGSGGYASGDYGQKLGWIVTGVLSGTVSLNVSMETYSGGPVLGGVI